MPKVSVIVPCFNLGKYINETIDSVLNQTLQDFEIIVVNDGSTDADTISILEGLKDSKIKLINTENQGLACARNNGITASAGKYILPLDADDKIAPTYLEKAVAILDTNKNIGIAYCLAEFFDQENFQWDLPPYELPKMLIDNLIFCSAFFRKQDWELAGGYKSSMKYGWEDYELWMSIIELKREIYRIPEYLFFYRVRADSMANVMLRNHHLYSYKEIVKNHKDLYINNIESIYAYIYSLRDEISERQKYQSLRDTEIHELNLEVLRLNEIISNLNQKTTNLRNQLSNMCGLTRRVIRLAAQKIGLIGKK